jgi:hypothetical protein
MLIHVHKVVHLVVGTLEHEWRSCWSEEGDRHCEIVTGRWTYASGHIETWTDLEQNSDRTPCVHCSSSDRVTHGGGCFWTLARREEERAPLCVRSKRTCHVRSWEGRSVSSLEVTGRYGWRVRSIPSVHQVLVVAKWVCARADAEQLH